MTRQLASAAILVALGLAPLGAALAIRAARRGGVSRAAGAIAHANAALLTLATLAMVFALVTNDFSVSYVAQVGSRATPLLFSVISLWSALEGSILFWAWVLAAMTALVVWTHRGRHDAVSGYATATLLLVGAFFFLLLALPANPFRLMVPTPPDGPGPNPLLQNHVLMAVHPPLLYLGYVGMTVPFAFAMGALFGGALDGEWARTTRRWTLVSWSFLSAAIVAGMWWSYEVLGWGGYWAWDPVENASLMPWLTATAFLHSTMVEERRGMLKVWNVTLVIATFLLTILGTFLTRSGVLSSVHAFTSGAIGYYFLIFIALVLLVSLTVLAGRGAELRSPGRLDAAASRETVFLANNLLLSVLTFTVLLGTLFPLVAEAVRGVKVSVGAPFFNQMTLPLCVALLFLMGVGPALPWRRADLSRTAARLRVPLVLLGLAALASLLYTRAPYAVAGFAFAAFALGANVLAIASGARARARSRGEPAPVAAWRLMQSSRRRYGGYVAHVGVAVAAVGVVASSTFRDEREVTLGQGAEVQLAGRTLRYHRTWGREEAHRFVVGATLHLVDGGRVVDSLTPRLNFFNTSEQPIATPAVRSRFTGDLYVNLMAFERDGSRVTVRVLAEPLVPWIWAGGAIVVLGGLFAAWPESRRRGRLAGAEAATRRVRPLEEPRPEEALV